MIYQGDALTVLKTLPEASVNCCITSPPYYGLRDYGTARWEGGDPSCDHTYNHGVQGKGGDRANRTFTGQAVYLDVCRKCGARRVDQQIGLESTPAEYISRLVEVFREARRVLRDDGTLWVNIGDSYASGNRRDQVADNKAAVGARATRPYMTADLKPKDLIGVPWMLAFALRDDGWYLRSEIIWAKPNPMPESVHDRPTKSHEQLFLLSKNQRYYYDSGAVAEESAYPGNNRAERTDTRKLIDPMCIDGGSRARTGNPTCLTRNRRSVWTMATQPTPEAHFATFPVELPETCLLAGTAEGGTVLDPFCGAGTTGIACIKNRREFIGIELNPEYIEIANKRLGRHHANHIQYSLLEASGGL
jgi:site-specific DNA-methyltransferase (cytosine-N4-specific)